MPSQQGQQSLKSLGVEAGGDTHDETVGEHDLQRLRRHIRVGKRGGHEERRGRADIRVGLSGGPDGEATNAAQTVQRMPRRRGQGNRRIDWRHMADWLARKPGAFARYVYREEMFPSVTYRRAYEALCRRKPERADTEYVRILRLASGQGEEAMAQALELLLLRDGWANETSVRAALGLGIANAASAVAAYALTSLTMTEATVNLAQYDELMRTYATVNSTGQADALASRLSDLHLPTMRAEHRL